MMTSLAQWKRSASKESAALQAYSRRCRRTRGVQILAMHASEQGDRIHRQQAVSAKPKLLWVGEHQDHLCLAAPRRMQALLTQLALQPVQGRVPLGGTLARGGGNHTCRRWRTTNCSPTSLLLRSIARVSSATAVLEELDGLGCCPQKMSPLFNEMYSRLAASQC